MSGDGNKINPQFWESPVKINRYFVSYSNMNVLSLKAKLYRNVSDAYSLRTIFIFVLQHVCIL